MKYFFRVFIAGILFLNCSSDDDRDLNDLITLCSVENPTVDLTWLSEEIERRESNATDFSKYDYISQSRYKGEVVIIYLNCCPICNSVFVVYNCLGEQIGIIGSREEDIPYEVLEDDQIIWKGSGFMCSI